MSSFSHLSLVNLDNNYSAKLLFPGASKTTEESYGYIRSKARAETAYGASANNYDLPLKSYNNNILTNAEELIKKQQQNHLLLISARNVFNEYGYYARIDNLWYGCTGKESLKPEWPVAVFKKKKIQLIQYKDISSNDDILTGLPLVINGKAVSRPFIVANCSDQSHVYNIHPKGLIGPSSEVWHELSQAWELAKQKNLSDNDIFQILEKIAAANKVKPSRHLLHSIMAQTQDNQIFFMAITGSLTDIAIQLVLLNSKNAILLDNGGSVSWRYVCNKDKDPITLVAGPNHRPNGTAFIAIRVKDFIQPKNHFIFEAI